VDDPDNVIGEIGSSEEGEDIGCGYGEENPEESADEKGFAMRCEEVIFDTGTESPEGCWAGGSVGFVDS
jgi:hypothetical protein